MGVGSVNGCNKGGEHTRLLVASHLTCGHWHVVLYVNGKVDWARARAPKIGRKRNDLMVGYMGILMSTRVAAKGRKKRREMLLVRCLRREWKSDDVLSLLAVTSHLFKNIGKNLSLRAAARALLRKRGK